MTRKLVSFDWAVKHLPKRWTDERERAFQDSVEFKTKSQLALDIVDHARFLGIRYAWVGVDGGYGNEPQFLVTLDDDGEIFVADVHKDQSTYLRRSRAMHSGTTHIQGEKPFPLSVKNRMKPLEMGVFGELLQRAITRSEVINGSADARLCKGG